MRIFKWLFLAVVWSLVAAFFHYQLPRTDIVRIVGADVQRFDVGDRPWFWSQAASTGTFAGFSSAIWSSTPVSRPLR